MKRTSKENYIIYSIYISALLLFIAFFAILIQACAGDNNAVIEEDANQSNKKIYTDVSNIEQSDSEKDSEAARAKTMQEKCAEIYNSNKDLLILVNKQNKLPDDYSIELKTTNIIKYKFAKVLNKDLTDMMDAGGEEGHRFLVISAYRTLNKQQSLVDADVAKYMNQGMNYNDALEKTYRTVMPAGYSEHHTGLALDIVDPDNQSLTESQADTPSNKWLVANCHKYGFILRYPKDKVDITEINYEPWHFRYVGKEAAQFLQDNSLTLEEFYDYLQL